MRNYANTTLKNYITLKNGFRCSCFRLSVRLVNKFKELCTFSNPILF